MPWHDNAGNGTGSGDQDRNDGPTQGPWGQPPRGGRSNGNGRGPGRPGRGGSEPPDIEELLEASRERLRRAFPGRRGGDGGGRGNFQLNGPVFLIGAGAALALWLFSGFYQVEADELAVVTTFGDYDKVSGPGLHWRIPSPVQNVQREKVTEVKTTAIPAARARNGGLSEGLMLTGDKNIVDVLFEVQWKIKGDLVAAPEESLPGVAQFMFNIDNGGDLLKMVAESAMREVVGRNTLDFVQTEGREAVATQVKSLIQESLNEYRSGIQVEKVNLLGAEPPTEEVEEAFRDVQAAEQDQSKIIEEARAYANKIVPEARGQAQRILEEARGYEARVTAESLGQAERFEKIYEEYAQAPEVTRQRMYFETMEKALADMNKIIIDQNAGSGVVPYLPLDQVRGRPQGGQE